MATLDSGAGAPRRPHWPPLSSPSLESDGGLFFGPAPPPAPPPHPPPAPFPTPPSLLNQHAHAKNTCTHTCTPAPPPPPPPPPPSPSLSPLGFSLYAVTPPPPNTTSTPPRLTPLLPGTLVCPPAPQADGLTSFWLAARLFAHRPKLGPELWSDSAHHRLRGRFLPSSHASSSLFSGISCGTHM